MAEQDNGTDVEEHQKTFEGFLRIAAGVFVVVLLILVFLAIVGT